MPLTLGCKFASSPKTRLPAASSLSATSSNRSRLPAADGQYSAVYNALSFVIASMGSSTIYFWIHLHMVKMQYRSALAVSSLVTLIAFYHYMRIFDSFSAAYAFAPQTADSIDYTPVATGQPFNDAYRYMDWLLTVPLLLIELILVMDLGDETRPMCTKLGVAATLMIILGYPGEISDDNAVRWIFWVLAMIPFIYIVFVLFVGLKDAVAKQPENARGLVNIARWLTVVSWCTYPVVFVLPMLFDLDATGSLIGIQVGYSISDVISKCGLGIYITQIALAKSVEKAEDALAEA